jgi:signal transduction histidine kinase/CheY-like chemotaxis protein
MVVTTPTAILLVTVIVLAFMIAFLSGKAFRSETRLKLTQQQLEQSQAEIRALKSAAAAREKAEAASEAKSRFLATVSHEFRTPLNGILGLAELLAATPLSAEQSSYLAAIRASGDALSSLINEILDFSRLEAGKLELRSIEFDLPALIEGTVELLSPRAQGKGIEVCSIVEHTLPRFVIGDIDRLRQVLINLIGNAIKFTERGGVAVEVSPSVDGNIRFSVLDTGPGIQASQRSSIFEEFEQGDGSSTRRHEGTGLGLAISRRIVEHMGGKLWLEDSGPQGSKFCLDLPIAQPSTSPPRDFSSRLMNQRILILGNSAFGAEFLARRLSDAGAQAIVCRDRDHAAIEFKAQKFEPNVVVVDCSLGEREISDLANFSNTLMDAKKLLLFSPFERREFGEAVLKDFDGWLVKPIRLESVVTKIVHLYSRQISTRPSSSADSFAPLLLGKHILLAEDNEVNALLIERQLCKLGASVHRARNGIEAIEFAAQSFTGTIKEFTAILMDVRMPKLDGLSAAKEIRAMERRQLREPIQIIALTANAFDDDRASALRAGIQTFMTKPVDLGALIKTLLTEGYSTSVS